LIPREKAIDLAIRACQKPHVVLIDHPTEINAELIPWGAAGQIAEIEGAPTPAGKTRDAQTWLIQIKGKFQVMGGPKPDPSTVTPFTPTPAQPFPGKCAVILDAITGDLIILQNTRDSLNDPASRPLECAPLPVEPTADSRPQRAGTRPSTPTPNLATQMSYRTTTPTLEIFTPAPTPHIVDLSPGFPMESKYAVAVYRCDGTMIVFLLDPALFPDALPLTRGDTILNSYPLQHPRPPEPTEPPTATLKPGTK